MGQWLAGLALVLFLLIAFFSWRFARRYKFNPLQVILYWMYWPWTRFYWPTTYEGAWPLKLGEGAVCVCNHTSGIDPFFLQRPMPTMARWMVAKEFFVGFMGWFLRQSRAIPVSRSHVGSSSTKAAISNAQQGGIVGMFPEGRINTTDEVLLPGRAGAAMVAIKAGVPIVPAYIQGVPYSGTPLSSFRKRGKVHVIIGKPIHLSEFDEEDEKELQRQITLRCLKEIARLAGHPEFEPSLAGRHWNKQDNADEAEVSAEVEPTDS